MTFFPTTVVAATDGSAAARHAVLTAAELCAATGSPLHLAHVKLTAGTLRGRPMTPRQRQRTGSEGGDLLDREAALVAEQGHEVAATHLRHGERAHLALAHLADELDAGLLVLGERGRGHLARQLSGVAPATSTLRRTPVSVLVVRSAGG